MKKIVFLPFVLIALMGSFAQKGTVPSNLLHDIVNKRYEPKAPKPIISMVTVDSYAQLSEDGKRVVQYSYKSGKEELVLFDAAKAKGVKIESIAGYIFSPQEDKLLVYTNVEKLFRRSFVADYYVFDIKRNRLEALSDSVGKQRDPIFSPNGRMIVFGKGNDLRLKKLDYGTETLVTSSGVSGTVCNGITDWLYEEEFAVTSLIAWSPDSKSFAYVSLDQTAVGTYDLQLHGNYPFQSDADLYPTLKQLKYPKAGTANPIPSVYMFDVFYRNTKKLTLPIDDDFYIPRIKWINNTEDFALFVLNRNQNRLRIFSVNSKSLLSKVLVDEQRDTYIDYENLDFVSFLNDNRFTFVSEKDGYRHLYLYNPNGILEKQLTSGKYDITDFYGYDSIKKLFFYQAAEKSPLNREVYSVDVKGKKSLLTPDDGVHAAAFSRSYNFFIKKSSNVKSPTVYSVCQLTGKELWVIEDNNALAKKTEGLPQKEFLTVKNASGDELHAWMLKPQTFDPNKQYPLVLVQYSGPNSQEVLNEFTVGFEQFLLSQGFVVACVDGRGTGARGEDFRKCTYQQLGVLEAQDQVAAATYFGSLSFIDKSKIGIWGWSYGGYTTLMAMSTGEKVFASGVAVAPLTDWKFYDTAYTERYMRRPQENLGGYSRSSPLALADKLQGRLLLISGTADDNVHIQNTLAYTQQLMEANKMFDLQLYTNCNHHINTGNARYHLYSRMALFFAETLK